MTNKSRHFLFLAIYLFAQLGHTQTLAPTMHAGENYEIPATVNGADLVKDLNLKQFAGKTFKRKIKVAVLDNGFVGRIKEVANKNLPEDTKYHQGPEIKDTQGKKVIPSEFHGAMMARLLMMVLQKSGAKYDVDLHLIEAHGITRFTAAVEKVIEEKYDIVLYAQVWEFGGNVDGKGFINALVDKAVKSGVLWIQATGNFNEMTRVAPVDVKREGTDEWVVFTNSKGKTSTGVTINCDLQPTKEVPKPKCQLRLVLIWNSFKDDATIGTDKDLDLFVFDRKGTVVASSTRNQKIENDGSDPLASKVPRELIEQTLVDPGTYTARVKVKSPNFSASQDQLRLLLRPPFTMRDPSAGETLLPPADNAGVIVIGGSDDPHTGVSKSMSRPHILLRSLLKLTEGPDWLGSSSASAIAAGMAVLFLGTGTENTPAAMLAALKTVSAKKAPVPLAPPQRERPKPPPQVAQNSPSQQSQRPPQQQPSQRPPPQQQQPQPGQPQYPPTGYPPNYPPQQMPPGQQMPPQAGMPMPMPMPPPPPPRPICLYARPLPVPYLAAQQVLLRGGAASVDLGNGRAGILTSYNFAAAIGFPSLNPGDKIFVTPKGPVVLAPQQYQNGVPIVFYEVIARPIPVCDTTGWRR